MRHQDSGELDAYIQQVRANDVTQERYRVQYFATNISDVAEARRLCVEFARRATEIDLPFDLAGDNDPYNLPGFRGWFVGRVYIRSDGLPFVMHYGHHGDYYGGRTASSKWSTATCEPGDS